MKQNGRTPKRLALVLALCLSAAGSALAHTPRSCTEEISTLKQRMVDLQRRATVGEVEVARLRQEIARLERELQAARRSTAAAAAPPPAEDVPTGPIVLASGVEESELEEDPLAAIDDPEPAAGEVATPPGSGRPPSGAPTLEDPTPEEPALETPAAETTPEALSLYDEGYTLYHQRRYRDAEERFRRYLSVYPESELADNAQFWIGECHYARKDFEAALAAFTTTVERYPRGNKIADALLKAGKCLEALGRIDQARQTYHEVTDRFPTAAAAVIARERLAALP